MLQHRNTNEDNFKALKEIVKNENDINKMYDIAIKDNSNLNLNLPLTYNNMGVRYRNNIDVLNDIPTKASNNSITFSGYTGPMFTIDFDNKVIVIIMCNVMHNTKLDRNTRKAKTLELMNIIFDNLIKT